jgi:hypothetical protein
MDIIEIEKYCIDLKPNMTINIDVSPNKRLLILVVKQLIQEGHHFTFNDNYTKFYKFEPVKDIIKNNNKFNKNEENEIIEYFNNKKIYKVEHNINNYINIINIKEYISICINRIKNSSGKVKQIYIDELKLLKNTLTIKPK